MNDNVIDFNQAKAEAQDVETTPVVEQPSETATEVKYYTEEMIEELPPHFRAAFHLSKDLNIYLSDMRLKNQTLREDLEKGGTPIQLIMDKVATPFVFTSVLANDILMDNLKNVLFVEHNHFAKNGMLEGVDVDDFIDQHFQEAMQEVHNAAHHGLSMLNQAMHQYSPYQMLAVLACMTKIVADSSQHGWYESQVANAPEEESKTEVTE